MSDKYAKTTLMWIYIFRTLLFQLQDSVITLVILHIKFYIMFYTIVNATNY